MYFEDSVGKFPTQLCFFGLVDRADSTKRAKNPEGRTGPVVGRGRKRIDGQTQVRLEFSYNDHPPGC